jgi:poly-gamma-glutamate synthesis protein (capsule biosynthesis protein)
VDVVHGHSSHHPRPIEVYRGRLILYGCGDVLSDYEGITGYGEYRPDRALLYLAQLGPGGELVELRMVPFRLQRLRLARAPADDARWLAATLDRVSSPMGARVEMGPDASLRLVVR